MKIKFVSATIGEYRDNLPIVKSQKKYKFDLDLITNNKDGLGTVYNRAIEKYKNNYDAIVLVHDDVLITDDDYENKLKKYLSDYDIIGLAGASYFNLKNPYMKQHPLSWHNVDRLFYHGIVDHYQNGQIKTSNFGSTPADVVTIDGLFIAINLKNIDDKCRFDEQFKFDFYDLSFSLTAKLLFNMRIGVIDLRVCHYSIGKGILKPEYREAEKLFIKKWAKV